MPKSPTPAEIREGGFSDQNGQPWTLDIQSLGLRGQRGKVRTMTQPQEVQLEGFVRKCLDV